MLTDVHGELAPPWRRSWINDYEPEKLETRIAHAVEYFGGAKIELLLLLGDITETGHTIDFDRVIGSMTRLPVPIAAVAGNHDLGAEPGMFAAAAQRCPCRTSGDESGPSP